MSDIRRVTNSELVSCTIPPMVGGDDSTVVGITQRSPSSGERVGERVQGGLFQKDKVRLTHALVTVHYNLSYRTTCVHRQTFCGGMFSIPSNNGNHFLKQTSLILPKSNT